MQIQIVEQRTGLDRATIRYYEYEGLINPQRLQNGYRDYSESQLLDLEKIKLLRQLGFSIEAIQQIMEGKEELQSAVKNQLILLKDHKENINNAETICNMILEDRVTYHSMQPNKYYKIPSNQAQIETKETVTPYTDYVYLESHPVRRFVGRYLDELIISSVLMLIFIVILRIRPFGKVQNSLLNIAAIFLIMPINALFLCIFGTTPGKFAVGIYIKKPNGTNMSFTEALHREWQVFCYGYGFRIPIYTWYRLYKAYKVHTEGRELEWDYDADVLYTGWSNGRFALSGLLGVICAALIVIASFDAQLPKHRTVNLTLAQFSENYNVYAEINGYNSFLTEKGEWYSPNKSPTQIVTDTPEYEEYWNFITNEAGILKQIKLKQFTSAKVIYSTKISNLVYTALMSQPHVNLSTVDWAMQDFSALVLITDPRWFEENNYDGVKVRIEYRDTNQLAGSGFEQHEVNIEITFP